MEQQRRDPATCADSLSGVAGCSADEIVATEGGDQVRFGHVTDRAGHTATVSVANINIDRTAPTLVFDAPSPAANGDGWNNTDVAIGFTLSDALSGIAPASGVSPLLLREEGAAVSGQITVTDRAGNSATFTSHPVRIDKTPPVVTSGRSPAANGFEWNNAPVTVEFSGHRRAVGPRRRRVGDGGRLRRRGGAVALANVHRSRRQQRGRHRRRHQHRQDASRRDVCDRPRVPVAAQPRARHGADGRDR